MQYNTGLRWQQKNTSYLQAIFCKAVVQTGILYSNNAWWGSSPMHYFLLISYTKTYLAYLVL